MSSEWLSASSPLERLCADHWLRRNNHNPVPSGREWRSRASAGPKTGFKLKHMRVSDIPGELGLESAVLTDWRHTGHANGRVKWFNNAKGYGFVLAECADEDLFVHYSSIQMNGYRTLRAGQEVTFDIQQGPKGLHAVNVRTTDDEEYDSGATGDDSQDAVPDSPESGGGDAHDADPESDGDDS